MVCFCPSQVTPDAALRKKRSLTSQIEGPTPKNTYGFKVSQGNVQDAKALHVVRNHLFVFFSPLLLSLKVLFDLVNNLSS